MNSKIILLEGPDNVGKSTQAKLLLKNLCNLPTHTIHYSNIPELTSEESRTYSFKLYNNMFKLIHWSIMTGVNVIFDRAHIGENVYAPIYRNYSGNFIFDIEDIYKNEWWWKNIYLFLFIDVPRNLINRDDGKSFSTKIKNKTIELNTFIKTINKSRILNKYIIDINNKSIYDVHNEIIKQLNVT